MIHGKLYRGVRGLAVVALLALGTAAASAQTAPPEYAPPPPPPAAYYPPPARPFAMGTNVSLSREPCGGDFGMLEGLEADRHDVPEASPTGGPYCR